jgi:hypothetical protein
MHTALFHPHHNPRNAISNMDLSRTQQPETGFPGPETAHLASTMDVALQTANELYRVQQRTQTQLRQLSTANQLDHETAFLTIFNRAVLVDKQIPHKYRHNPECANAYKRGHREGLRKYILKRFPYVFGVTGDVMFDRMWDFAVNARKSKISKETAENELEAMMSHMNLGTENIKVMVKQMDLGVPAIDANNTMEE